MRRTALILSLIHILLENKEPISRKIEKVTEELLSEWEISEDDFEETGDLTETSRRLAEEVIGRREGEMAGKNVRSIREEGAVREKSGRPQQADSRSTAPASGRDIERKMCIRDRDGICWWPAGIMWSIPCMR